MGLYKYSFQVKDEKKVARAQVHDIDASYKDLGEVARAIRGRSYAIAVKTLEDAISMKRAIHFKRHAARMGHRSELGGQRGKYPKKEARVMLAILKDAKASADAKGLDAKTLIVLNACAFKQNKFMRYRRQWVGGMTLGYGKQSMASKYVTCRAEITLGEHPQGNKITAEKKSEKKTAEKKSTEKKADQKEKPAQHAAKVETKETKKE